MSTRAVLKSVAFASVPLVLVIATAIGIRPALAETGGVPELKDFTYTLIRLIQVGLAAAAPVAAIFLIIGGIKYATATGDPKALEEAKRTVTYSVLGLIVAVGAITIVTLTMGLLGVPSDWDWKKVFIPERSKTMYNRCNESGQCVETECEIEYCPDQCDNPGYNCSS